MKKRVSLTSSDIRLNKAIADSGYCARRKADQLIADGCVQVNGETVITLGLRVNPDQDCITIHGKPLPVSRPLYLLMNKPTGLITSRRAKTGQKTIYTILPLAWHTADPAGRLDQDSSGALLLSNDGDFLFQITHPGFHLPKVYEVTLHKPLSSTDLERLETGVLLQPENKLARMQNIQICSDNNNPYSYRIELMTGYKRQIRRTMALQGYRVITLRRLSIGPVSLGSLPLGECRELTPDEINALRQGWKS